MNSKIKFKIVDKTPKVPYRHMDEVFVIDEDGDIYVVNIFALEKVVEGRFKVQLEIEK